MCLETGEGIERERENKRGEEEEGEKEDELKGEQEREKKGRRRKRKEKRRRSNKMMRKGQKRRGGEVSSSLVWVRGLNCRRRCHRFVYVVVPTRRFYRSFM